MSEKLPMMVLISSPRMRRGEASDLEEMFDLGLELSVPPSQLIGVPPSQPSYEAIVI